MKISTLALAVIGLCLLPLAVMAQPELSGRFIGCRAAHLGREAYGLFAGSGSGETDSRDQSAGPGKSDPDCQVEEG